MEGGGVPCGAGNCPEAAVQPTNAFPPDDGFHRLRHSQSVQLQAICRSTLRSVDGVHGSKRVLLKSSEAPDTPVCAGAL